MTNRSSPRRSRAPGVIPEASVRVRQSGPLIRTTNRKVLHRMLRDLDRKLTLYDRVKAMQRRGKTTYGLVWLELLWHHPEHFTALDKRREAVRLALKRRTP